jgi:hypothetical protein
MNAFTHPTGNPQAAQIPQNRRERPVGHPDPAASRATRPQELLRHPGRQLSRGQALAGQPAAQIRQQVHVINDRVQGVPLTGELATQPVSERRKRPAHDDPSTASRDTTRVHDRLLSVDGLTDQTRETADHDAQPWTMPLSQSQASTVTRAHRANLGITARSS